MDNLSTVRYDATRENVPRGGLASRLLLSLHFERSFFVHARWLYKIGGGRDETLVVDIYRCDEDDF